ncbi:MAG: V-type ATP synthase subunit F [Candidatus Diapherotrites archaeon]|nr:V-type ATP synthase subunit F [Candidatus Diapherotrites archaeon]
MEIAILGNDEFVTGFRLSGVKNIITAEGKELSKKIEEVIDQQKIGILVMEHLDFSQLNNNVKKKLDRTVTPVVVTLSKDAKTSDLRELVKKSIGIDLWK